MPILAVKAFTFLISPAGRVLAFTALAAIAFGWWSIHLQNAAIERERARVAKQADKEKSSAFEERLAITRAREAKQRQDDEEQGRIDAERARIRDLSKGDDILWPAGDSWLQSKR